MKKLQSTRPRARQGSRRKFIASLGLLSTAGAGLVAAPSPAPPAASAKQIACDVLVVGGGTAGTIAALQAARLNAQTILVEAGSQLGGTTTTGGVDFPGLFHAWGRQRIAGIGWELVQQTVALNGDRFPDFSVPTGPQHYKHQVRLCGGLYAALAEEACVKAGVQLRYYEFPLAIEPHPQGWRVELAGKGTRVEVLARQIIDCTGNAAAIGLLGLPRLREETTQPGTLIYHLGGYQIDRSDPKLMGALETKAREAVKQGLLLETDFNRSLRGFLGAGGENAMHVPGADSSTSETHTQTNIKGRQSLVRVMRFLKTLPGFEKLRIERLQPETAIRETFRIVGESTITQEDYISGRNFPDAVCYSFYPIDLHVEHGVKPRHLQEGIVPSVPLGALIPKGSQNVMVAGRCVSSDRLANSALRVQASCMAMGQAAGAAAALAALSRTTPARVPLETLRAALQKHGAIVPPA